MVVLNFDFLQARFVDFRSSAALTRPTKVFPIVLATYRCLYRPIPATTRCYVLSMRLRVDLTLLCVHLTRRHARLELLPEALRPTSFRPLLYYCCCSVNFFTTLFIFLVLLIFCIFVLPVLFCFLWAFISLP